MIDFPESGESPDWAQAVDQFAQAVESALSGVVNSFDIPPQNVVIDSLNPGTLIVPGLAFPTSNVRAAFLKYAVFRKTTTTTVYESGYLDLVYSPDNPIGNKWELVREYTGDGKVDFTISDTGQITFITTTIAGLSHTGQLTYTASTLLQS